LKVVQSGLTDVLPMQVLKEEIRPDFF